MTRSPVRALFLALQEALNEAEHTGAWSAAADLVEQLLAELRARATVQAYERLEARRRERLTTGERAAELGCAS